MINDYEATKPITQDATYRNTESLSNDDVISTLNGLIQTCKDGQDGYQAAADGIERSGLKSLFYESAQQRSRFAGELQSLVHSLGGDPDSLLAVEVRMSENFNQLHTRGNMNADHAD